MTRAWVFPLALALGGCANISGLSSLDIGEGDGGASDAGDGGVTPDGAGDVTSDVKVCAKTETDCTDGIDNDCNGKTDCEEPSCTQSGFACADEVPNAQFGWYSATSKPACPGTSAATDLVTSVVNSGSPSCSCSCTVSASCPATVSLENTENNQCTAVNNTRTLTLDNACHAAAFDIQLTAKTPALSSGTTCSPKATLPNLVTTNGRICKSQLPKGGGGCGTGKACLPIAPVASFKACMIMPANTTCPQTWPTAATVGTGINDARTCSACGCSAAGGCTGTVSFYSGNTACLTNPIATVPLGTCATTGVNATTIGSYKTTTTTQNASCTNNSLSVSLQGSASLSGQMSLCCAN